MFSGLTLHSLGGHASLIWSMVCESGTLGSYSLMFYLICVIISYTTYFKNALGEDFKTLVVMADCKTMNKS